MRDNIEKRILQEAAFVVDTGSTIRACAAKFGVSKTTVHKDMRTRLPRLDPALARRVGRTLDINLAQRHLRGGMATKRKYARRAASRAESPAKGIVSRQEGKPAPRGEYSDKLDIWREGHAV